MPNEEDTTDNREEITVTEKNEERGRGSVQNSVGRRVY